MWQDVEHFTPVVALLLGAWHLIVKRISRVTYGDSLNLLSGWEWDFRTGVGIVLLIVTGGIY